MCRGTTQVKQVKDICFLDLMNPPDLNALHGCASAQSIGHEVGRGPKICKQRRSFSCPLVFKFSRLEPETPQYFYYLSELSKDEKRKKNLTEFQERYHSFLNHSKRHTFTGTS